MHAHSSSGALRPTRQSANRQTGVQRVARAKRQQGREKRQRREATGERDLMGDAHARVENVHARQSPLVVACALCRRAVTVNSVGNRMKASFAVSRSPALRRFPFAIPATSPMRGTVVILAVQRPVPLVESVEVPVRRPTCRLDFLRRASAARRSCQIIWRAG